ncbi:putative Lysophospholipase, Monoglyceride lipase [Pseudonocardia sp. Ae168_Ps1]|uniref:alpha/beta hydrolase n=1 Tax=unclassified Pseudonocardia TaxID=2619320 RepID=UPI000761FBE0|nr:MULTISPECIES: alpha/beta hydrolase [unclassified Pseudonocardia]OLL75402.1 putative Lysophospholipase Monoglyceride lipase [Pseudonocardia sp. Ae150A_Ps1]OLL81397.1 putative Lysophospholipase, Monoglyceride lipase [Pseudonocardia sp. Ae168_Ps1]OLL84488.1 putative Lysophospholipase, Monoglyceride lipase [Pseudonocardia sp. Ae263_Ps1]OLL95492.1 putative Lysophospholipase, Monoglyceride lipase [Pseudonocardia sp. Ae356_Ps1]
MTTAPDVQGRLPGVGGVELFWQGWLPPGDVAGVLLLSHGIGEHSGRYGTVVDTLRPDGWAVYGLDHRGHGRSGGTRVHVRRYDDLLQDFETFRREIVARHPGVPVYLLGHSLGGQIALAYALRHQDRLDGLALSAPALASDTVPAPLVPVLSLVARVLPTVRPVGIDTSAISSDPAVVDAYEADPLVHHGKPTLALGAAVYAQMDDLPPRAAELRLPLLVQHGTADRLTDPAGTRKLDEASGSADTTVRWYDGLWHEIYHEPGREGPLTDLRRWLAEHRDAARHRTG